MTPERTLEAVATLRKKTWSGKEQSIGVRIAIRVRVTDWYK